MDAPAVTVGNNIYTFTAVSNNAVVANSYKFDGTTWTAIAAYPVTVEYPSACTDGVNIYVMGGANSTTGAPTTALYRYNVASNTYTLLAPFSVATWNQSSVFLNGKIYKFGGSAAAGSATALEIYDVASNTWSTGASMPLGLSFIAATTAGGYIYSVGGVNGTTGAGSAKTYRYDPATNTWDDAAIADLPVDRWGASAYLYGPYNNYGSFALAGGYVSGAISNTALQWDPASNTWTTLPAMNTISARFAAASLNGAYYALGGRQANNFVGSTFNQKLQCSFPACSGTPAPGQTMGPSIVCAGQPFVLSLQNVPSVSGLTFQWQSSADNVTYTNIAGATSGTLTTSQTATRWYRCQVTCSGQTGTSTPLQVLDGQGIFTSQPSNTSVQCGGNATFSFTATGLSLVYNWEYRVNSSSPWQNVPNAAPYSGANTNTLTITDVPSTLNGYQYRAVMQGSCTAVDFSNIVTLTVTPLVATVSPSSATICTGSIQQLSITNVLGTPPVTTLNFPSGALSLAVPDNTDNGVSHTVNVSGVPAGAVVGAARVTLNMTHTWVGDMVFVLRAPNGQILNLDFYLNSTGGAGVTTGFTNTVISSTGTTTLNLGSNPYTGTFRADAATGLPFGLPSGPAGFAPTTASWSALYNVPVSQINGGWTLAMYDGGPGDLGVLTSWTLTLEYTAPAFATGIWTSNPSSPNTMFTDPAATVPYTGTSVTTIYVKPTVNTVYSVVVTTPTPCTSGPTNVPVNVVNPVSNVVNPTNKSVCVGGNTSFSVSASGGPINYQWQVSTNAGATYTNIAGATSSTLTLNNVTQSMHNNLYRVVMSAPPCAGTTTTPAATLTVNPLPTVLLSANPTAVKPGTSTTIMVNSTPAGATYSWTFNGQPLSGVTGSSYVANVDGIGTYTVTVTDVNGCVSTSSPFTITGQQDSRLFIYPNPAPDGMFQVRLFSGINFDYRKVNIYNAAGVRVAHKEFPTSGPWEKMEFNLSNQASGVYMVEVVDRYDTKLASGKVVIQR
jgi:subtilisin-like proprotein convertase family protein/N-acetylneuraminic acid mutarotase